MNHPMSASSPCSGNLLRIGNAVFEPARKRLWSKGEQIALEPRLSDLLALLAQSPGQTIPRDRLLDSVWGANGSDEALTQAVSRLRRSLGDPQAIKTVPRIGYQLAVTPEFVEQDKLGGVVESLLPTNAPQFRSNRRLLEIRSALIGAAVGAALTTLFLLAVVQREVVFEVKEYVDGEFVTTTSQASCNLLSDCEESVVLPLSESGS